ncbi:hypothetical protein BDV96DRAFT_640976 [Lophiotrema nucula]|uniref:Uncharacterized protein n=1 Tax=Lophiotrema nucula TaxID=690887 RepID=A0A6A5ZPJ1_9PLEO|nr:hypothetical protein BDV96DRAFT_640976 [Lophiotrema nucula]
MNASNTIDFRTLNPRAQDLIRQRAFRQRHGDNSRLTAEEEVIIQEGLGRSEAILPETVIREAKEASVSIAKNYKLLKETLERYEDAIRKRWVKKKRDVRKEILLDAWGKYRPMAVCHRPDLQAFRRASGGRGARGSVTDSVDVYMWPHVNLEDLMDTTTILKFLNSRGRHAPALFAKMDLESMQLGRQTEALKLQHLPEFHWIDLESEDPQIYGRVKKLSKCTDKVENAVESLWVLKAQRRILKFLVKVCRGILHDKDIDGSALMEAPIQPEPPALTATVGEFSTALDLNREIPYLVPRKLDLSRLRSLIKSRLAEWEDYACAMREDPGFFAEVASDWSEHASERVLGLGNRKHPDLANPARITNFWDRTLSSAINEPYENLSVWTIINTQLDELLKLHNDFVESQTEEVDDDHPYLEHVGRIRFLLEVRLLDKLQRELRFIFPSSPPIRHMYQSTSMLELRSDMPKDDALIWLVDQLRPNESMCPAEIIVAELNRLIGMDKNQKDRITPMVARFVADLGLGYELRSQLFMLCPSMFDGYNLYENRRIMDWAKEKLLPLYDLKMIMGHNHAGDKFLKLGEAGNPSKLYYPVDKRPTKDNVESMQNAERNLCHVWLRFDAHMATHLKPATNAYFLGLFPKKEVQRTPDWVEPHGPAPKNKVNEVTQQMQQASFADENTGPGGSRFIAPEPKTKIKTRGQGIQPDSALAAEAQDAQNQKSRFTVKKKPKQVFSTLFYQPTHTQQPGEVPWTDFVQALAAIGFLPEKLYGSVWRFAVSRTFAEKVGVESAINFHEPHPQVKLPFRIARRYGRRLNKTYGLDGSSFVLES